MSAGNVSVPAERVCKLMTRYQREMHANGSQFSLLDEPHSARPGNVCGFHRAWHGWSEYIKDGFIRLVQQQEVGPQEVRLLLIVTHGNNVIRTP